MSLRSLGKLFEQDGVRLWLHPRVPFKALLIEEQVKKSRLTEDVLYVEQDGIMYLSMYYQMFLDFEGYVLDIEADNAENPLLLYWQNRRECETLEERFELMMACMGGDDYKLLRTAHKATRGETPQLLVPEGEKKVSSSSEALMNASAKAS